MKAGIITSTILLAAALLACNDSASKQEDTSKTDSAKAVVENKSVPDSTEVTASITAQFIDFTQGDASHFIFKDKTGKSWDFGGNLDTVSRFAVELPKNKANETNQGWAPDKKLQGKWFDITYIYGIQPEYPDGPMAKVAIITSAKIKE